MQAGGTTTSKSAFDPILCRCGSNQVFCKDPQCLSLYCEQCAFTLDNEQGFESCDADPKHKCCLGRARGPYCKHHFKKYLARCGDCGTVKCDIEECEGCNKRFCTYCLKDDQCERCRYDWEETRLEYGIESDDDYGSDPFIY